MRTAETSASATPTAPWVADLLACPRCKSRVSYGPGGWSCRDCGVVGRQTLGVPDFLGSCERLPLASSGSMDLVADEALARELQSLVGVHTFHGLSRLVAERRTEQQHRQHPSPARRRRLARFNRRFATLNEAATTVGGEAMLAKLDAKLSELRWPSLQGRLALEGGGGEGFYVRAFSERFDHVIFIDASLTNILMAAKLAEEQGLTNVAFVRADLTRLPLQENSFDLVHENSVVEHVADPTRMIREGVSALRKKGYYVCVSPNRMSILPEPHFRLVAFGFIPKPIRTRVVVWTRGLTFEEAGTEPRSLWELRRYLRAAGVRTYVVFFLPRHLPFTARQTRIRRLVRWSLGRSAVGDIVHYLFNRLLLPMVPQHIVIAPSRDPSRRASQDGLPDNEAG